MPSLSHLLALFITLLVVPPLSALFYYRRTNDAKGAYIVVAISYAVGLLYGWFWLGNQ